MGAKLTVVGSSSHGNGYLLQCGDDSLIIECGMPKKEVFKHIDWRIENILAAIVTHAHSDHAKYIRKYKKYGIPIYSNKNVREKYPCVHMLEPKKRYSIGRFTVIPLSVPHGDCECYAYHITLPDGQTLLFTTDLSDFPYSIQDINHLFIECNYSNELIVDRLCEGYDIRSSFDTHMELNTCISIIKRLQSSELNKVVLLHLSDANSDESLFRKRAWQECGIECECADSGKVYELIKDDF